jgi:hypothetical protein
MMCFVVERDFLKPALSASVSSELDLWSVMSAWGEETRVGAEVRPEVAEAVECDRRNTCVRCCMSECRLPEQEV